VARPDYFSKHHQIEPNSPVSDVAEEVI